MVDAAKPTNQTGSRPAPNADNQPNRMQRRAWTVLAIAFALFCVTCGVMTFGVYYFIYESSYPVVTKLAVSRGGVGLVGEDFSERFAFDEQYITSGDTVLTDPYDPQSQSTLTFEGINREVFASVTLKNASELQVARARQPRFEWSGNGYEITLRGIRGTFDVLVSDIPERETDLTFLLPNDTTVTIDTPGHYTVQLDDNALRLEANTGEAELLPPDLSKSRPIVGGQVGIYQYERAELRVTQGYDNLIQNRFFDDSILAADGGESEGVPLLNNWSCSQRDASTLGDPGAFDWVQFQGRSAVRLQRYGTSLPGKTECAQFFGPAAQVGRQVTGYDYLSVRTTFYIEHQSLSVCGWEASECPLMLLIDYIDMNGDPHKYYHGFYYKDDPNNDLPLRCNSPGCQEIKQVNEDKWYTYESGNLFTLLPGVSDDPSKRPASIINVRFYGSGHEYDVYVSEFSLLASPPTIEQATPADETPAPSPAATASPVPQ